MSELNFLHSNGNKVKLTTPDTLAANKTFKLPGADGSSGQAVVTDGNGALSFATIATTVEVDQWYLNQNATGGIIPCSTNSPNGTFGNCFLLFAIVTTSSFNTFVFFNRSFESLT